MSDAGFSVDARWGRYRILDRLGEGGMGVVFRAHDERLDREVALKFLPPRALGEESARRRFHNEALALAKLSHPNIATIFELETQGDTDFLVIEYIPGQTLDEVLLRGPLDEKEILRLAEQLAAGLSAAHEKGVLHRDLKPANIRVTPQGLLKILDFGLAKLLEIVPLFTAADATVSTVDAGKTGFAGTPPYMAPEQLRNANIDVRTDIYGAGAVLYEMAAGRRAFTQQNPSLLVQAILHSLQTPPRSLAQVSPALESVILKALAKDPEDRQQTAEELLQQLRLVSAPKPRRRVSRVVDSVAVLPFENATGNAQADYLSEGITDTLIHALSALPNFKKVIARSSVYRYRGRQVTPERAGRELDVRSILTGRLWRRAGAIAVSAELVDAADSRRLWGAQYECKKSELSGLEHSIANDVATSLGLKLKPHKAKARQATSNSQAYELYLKGRFYWNKRPGGGMVEKAIEYFEQASEADTKFALAYAGLADCYNILGSWEAGAMAPQLAFPQAKTAANRALRLNAQLAEAHTARAYSALHFDWDWHEAQQGFRRALQLNPNYVHAHHWYAHYLIAVGRSEQALAESLRIIELDPLDLIINAHLAWHYQMAHRYPEALAAAQKTLELEPNFHWGYLFAGWAHEQLGELDQAVDCLTRSVQFSGGSTLMKAALGHAYATSGDHRAARQVLEDLQAIAGTRYVSPYELGLIHLALREAEQGWELLERAGAEHSGWMPYLGAEPRLLQWHADPRYQRLLSRIAIPGFSSRPGPSAS